MRTGLIAKKLGMTRLFDEQGMHVPVTVLALDGCQVVGQRTKDKDGYVALRLGAGAKKAKNTTQAERGMFAKSEVEPKRIVTEFRVTDENLIDVGAEMTADHFVAGQKVDIQGTTIGKGFAGAMKRWNFGGMRATHGVSVSHRAHGSTGQRQDPGKVFKGKKMAGHLGVETVTTQNLTIVRVDADRGLLLVKGAVPGAEGSYVKVSDAIKRARPSEAPMPGGFRKAGAAKTVKDDAAPAEVVEDTIIETPVEAAAPEATVEAAAPEATVDTAAEETAAPEAPASEEGEQ